MQALEDEIGAELWRCFRQLYKLVSAFCVGAIDLVPGSFRFGEILFAFIVGFVDFLPWRRDENLCCISIFAAGGLQSLLVRQAYQASVSQRIWNATIEECWFGG